MRNHYIPYNPTTKSKPLYLLALSSVAEYNKKTRRYDTIHYTSLDALAQTITKKAGTAILSKATLSRLLQSSTDFLEWDKPNRTIYLLNDYSTARAATGKQPFVILNSLEVAHLLQMGDNFTV